MILRLVLVLSMVFALLSIATGALPKAKEWAAEEGEKRSGETRAPGYVKSSALGSVGLNEVPLSGLFVHRVRSGDTLEKVARLYRVQSLAVAKVNGCDPATPLRPGQQLLIPEN